MGMGISSPVYYSIQISCSLVYHCYCLRRRESEHHTEKDGISTHLNSAAVIAKIRDFVIMKKMTIVTVLYMKVKLHVSSVQHLHNIIQ